ncbi:MAG: response regulator [SAR324 cluster bacterium]|nr:response regulator [SAR324 cluster bacterium]
MRILLLEEDQKTGGDLKAQLDAEGFECLHLNQYSKATLAWETTPHISIIVISNATEADLRFIQVLRQYKPYVFLCCITHETNHNAFFSHGADQVALAGNFPELLSKIGSIARTHHILNQSPNSGSKEVENLQHLNLNTGLAFVEQDKGLYQELLGVLMDTLQPIRAQMEQLTPEMATELRTNTQSLGTEKLNYWLSNTLYHNELLDISEDYKTKQAQHYAFLIDNLVKEIDLLTSTEFFEGEKVTQENALASARILLVEDLIHNRILVQQIFKKHGPSITEAVHGEDAVEKWESDGPFDLILMDMNMPVMDGFEATMAIRRLELEKGLPAAPILALTALAMRGDRDKCLEAGCSDYMPKPLEPRQLIQVCTQMISKRKIDLKPTPKKERWWRVQKVAIYTKNLKFKHVLNHYLSLLNLECRNFETPEELLSKIQEKNIDLVFFDCADQLDFCFFLKTHYPTQELCLLLSQGTKSKYSANLPNAISFPFSQEQLKNRIGYHSHKILETEQNQAFIKDLEELKSIKNVSNLSETKELTHGQIAVWQKTFRKIGGDLVLCHRFNLHGRLGFIMADVSGHDLQSGYTANWFAGLVEGVWGNKSQPIELIQYLNQLFTHGYEEEDKRYVCALALLWDPLRGRLEYANAGIPGGIFTKIDQDEVKYIDWKGPPIGMFDEDHFFDYGEIDFNEGDRLFIATDGVLENIPNDVIVSLSQDQKNTQEALDRIVDFVLRSMEIKDDLTIAVFDPQKPLLKTDAYRNSITGEEASSGEELDRICKYLESAGATNYDWPMISVAIKEALLNAAEHGNKNHLALPIDIDAELTDRPSLKITISDRGSGFDLGFEKKRIQSEGQLRIQGRGIEIMEHVAEKVNFTGGSIEIEFLPQG